MRLFGKNLVWVSLLILLSLSGCSSLTQQEETLLPVSYPRVEGKSFLLKDNRVLILGGYQVVPYPNKLTTNLIPAELFIPEKNQITVLENSKAPSRQDSASTLLKTGKILITGGMDTQKLFNELSSSLIFDPVSHKHTDGPSMLCLRSRHQAELLPDGRVLILGGQSLPFIKGKKRTTKDDRNLPTTEIYDPKLNQFIKGPESDIIRKYIHVQSVTLQDGNILVTAAKHAELYLTKENKFVPLTDLNEAQQGYSMTRLRDGRVLIVGGQTKTTFFSNSAEIYTPVKRKFTLLKAMRKNRVNPAVVSLPNGQALIIGGTSIEPLTTPFSTRSVEIFHPEDNSFSPLPDMKYEHGTPNAIYIPNKGVLVSGQCSDCKTITPAELLKIE